MNYRLNIMGINTAEEFNQRLNERNYQNGNQNEGNSICFFNLNYINPTAINIGPLSIKWYGIIMQ